MLGRYMIGSTAARTGDEASGPALVLAALAVTGSPAPASALVACLSLTAALGGPLLGALLDRSAVPHRLLAAALAGYAAGLVGLAALLGHAPLPYLLLLAAVAGFFGPALTGGWTSRLGVLGFDGYRLRRAYAADTASYAVAGLAGPALAGALASGVGWRTGVLAAGLLLLLAVPVALTLPAGPRVPAARPIVSELRRGAAALLANPRLRAATAVSTLSYLGYGAATVAVPVLGRHLTGQAGAGAGLLSVLAVGSLASTAVLSRWVPRTSPDRQVGVSTVVLGGGLLLVALSNGLALAAVGLLVAGLADGALLAALLVVRHQETPVGLRAQVFGTAISLKQAGFALGAGLAGPLAARSLRTGLLLMAAAQVAALACGALAGHRSR